MKTGRIDGINGRVSRHSMTMALIFILQVMVALIMLTEVHAQRKERENADYERTVFGMGSNTHGAFGLADFRKPYLVKPLQHVQVKDWCASTDHVVVLTDEGSVFTWGLNNAYQAGRGDELHWIIEAANMTEISDIVPDSQGIEWDRVVCGQHHTVVHDSNSGAAVVWGQNQFGSTGLNHTNTVKRPQFVADFFGSSTGETEFFSVRDGAMILRRQSGAIHGIGYNGESQFGTQSPAGGSTTHKIDDPLKVEALELLPGKLVDVTGGLKYSFFRFENGDLYSTGLNSLGHVYVHFEAKKRLSNVRLVASNNEATWIVMESGDVHAFGDNTCGRVDPDLTKRSIDAAGGVHGNEAEIKMESTTKINTDFLAESEQVTKISISLTHVVVLTSEGRVFGLGCNEHGQLSTAGVDQDHIAELREFDHLPDGETIVDVIAMNHTTLLLADSGKLYAVGDPMMAGYGRGLVTPTVIETPKKMDRVYAGDDISYMITPYEGEVFAAGRNLRMLEDGSATDQMFIEQVDQLKERNITDMTLSGIRGDTYNVYALAGDRVTLYGYGNTLSGQLLCEKINCEDPVPDDPVISFTKVNINDTRFDVIDSGAKHFAAIGKHLDYRGENKLYLWGSNSEGQAARHGEELSGFPLEHDNRVDMCTGDFHTIVVGVDGDLYGTGRNQEGQIAHPTLGHSGTFLSIKPTSFEGKKVTAVFCGSLSTFVILDDGNVYVFGDNSNGQLGLGADAATQVKIPTLHAELSNLNKDGGGILKIASAKHGGSHTLVLTRTGELYGFGRNNMHQLGLGHSQGNFHIPTKIEIAGVSAEKDALKVVDVSAGYEHSLFVVGRKTCPNDCSNDVPRGIFQGECDPVVGQCVCNRGFTGFDCSQRTCADPLCSGAGKCDTSRGICRCDPGFSGTSCQYRRCPNNCSGQGKCNRNTGICNCDAGWTGVDCNSSGVMGLNDGNSRLIGMLTALALSVIMVVMAAF